MHSSRVLNVLTFAGIAIGTGFALCAAPSTTVQTSAGPLKFEVVSIKPFQEEGAARNARGGLITGGQCHGTDDPHPPTTVALGRCNFTHVSLTDLIVQAFPPTDRLVTEGFAGGNPNASLWLISAKTADRGRIMPLDQWVTNGPNWATSDFFSLEAKAENTSTVTVAQLRQMLQTFVKEQFKLTYHLKPKDVSGYFIVVGKGGAKLQPAPYAPLDPATAAKRRESGIKPFPVARGPLDEVALILTINMHAPVVNQTGIDGSFDYTSLDGVDFGEPGTTSSETPGGSIFTAMEEKLGLKLEPHKVAAPVFVIDHAEKPAQN
jgi:uncharacterized protein (TIGR03435 family)